MSNAALLLFSHLNSAVRCRPGSMGRLLHNKFARAYADIIIQAGCNHE